MTAVFTVSGVDTGEQDEDYLSTEVRHISCGVVQQFGAGTPLPELQAWADSHRCPPLRVT